MKNILISVVGLVTFGVLWLVGSFGGTYWMCSGAKDDSGCGDIILILAPIAFIFSAIVTIFLMKRLSSYLQNKHSEEFVGINTKTPEKIVSKKRISVALLIAFFTWSVSSLVFPSLINIIFQSGSLQGPTSQIAWIVTQAAYLFFGLLTAVYYLNKK